MYSSKIVVEIQKLFLFVLLIETLKIILNVHLQFISLLYVDCQIISCIFFSCLLSYSGILFIGKV